MDGSIAVKLTKSIPVEAKLVTADGGRFSIVAGATDSTDVCVTGELDLHIFDSRFPGLFSLYELCS